MSATAVSLRASTTAQEAYRSQLAQGRNERQMATLARSLDQSEAIAKASGVDASGAIAARSRITQGNNTPVESTKVSLSQEGLARLRAEAGGNTESRQTSNSKASDALREQTQVPIGAQAQLDLSIRNTNNPVTATAAKAATSSSNLEASSSSGRSERQQFRSVSEAIAYGASRAAAQANSSQVPESAGRQGNSNDNLRTGQSNAADTRKQDALRTENQLPYSKQRAIDQYTQQAQATSTARTMTQ